ncbi:lysophospholipid acyltransferase family protein [Candidatus Nitrosacidococcus tergens]|nr:lysophospholipid acyltransferase family protein [Candidatus Nitrosacidococcus tergens]
MDLFHQPSQGELFLRSFIFSIGQIISTIVFAFGGVCLAPFPFAWRYNFLIRWGRFNFWWLKKVCNLDFRVQGSEPIPLGPAIVFCKHQSAWETIALQRIFPPQIWVLRKSLLWIPFFGWGLALLDPIAIDRKAGRKALNQIIEQGKQRLKAGRWVVIFPEGTRMPPGEMGKFRIGGASLAQATGYPVIPVAHNAGYFWPKRGFIKYPGTIDVIIGPMIETKEKTADEINQDAYSWVAEAMKSIEPPRNDR